MALYKTDGVVLRTRNLGEADKILVLYTRSEGKISAVARGCRRPRSRLLAASQPFTCSRFLIFGGKGLHSVSQAELKSAFIHLREDLNKMAYASYISEMTDAATEENECNPELYELLYRTLSAIDEGRDREIAARAFELHLMILLGYAPHLADCAGCGEPALNSGVFSVELGGLLCEKCSGRDAAAVKLTRGTVEAIRRIAATGVRAVSVLNPSAEIRHEMEQVLRLYMEYRLEKKLRSRAFLDIIGDCAGKPPRGCG